MCAYKNTFIILSILKNGAENVQSCPPMRFALDALIAVQSADINGQRIFLYTCVSVCLFFCQFFIHRLSVYVVNKHEYSTSRQCGTVSHLLCVTIYSHQWTRSGDSWKPIFSDSDEQHPAPLWRLGNSGAVYKRHYLLAYLGLLTKLSQH